MKHCNRFMKAISAIALSSVLAVSGLMPALPILADEVPVAEAVTIPSEDMSGQIVILHTNDVHGAVADYATVSAVKKAYEKNGAYVLLMDAGDFSQGSIEVSLYRGASAIDFMNLAGYDISTVGNHELDYGFNNLKKIERNAEFPIVSANMFFEGKHAFETRKMFTAPDGKKIGVFGLTTPKAATSVHPSKQYGMTYLNRGQLYQCAQQEIDALKADGADYIICLSHLGMDMDTAGGRTVDLLAHVEGIDVLIDGHSHISMEEENAYFAAEGISTSAKLTSTGTKFDNIGVVTIKDGEITTECIDTQQVELKDEVIAEKVSEMEAAIAAEYGAIFAVTETDLNGEKAPGNRTEETNLGDLIADAMMWFAEENGEIVDMAINNGGGIRANIAKGGVSKKDVNTVLPFGNTVCIVRLTGAEILEMLEASTATTPEPAGAFPQVSGIEFTLDTSLPYDAGDYYPGYTVNRPNSIRRVSIQKIGGEPFSMNKYYTVATNDFVAAGGDSYFVMKAAEQKFDTGAPLDEVLIEYISEVLDGKITAERYGAPAGRIVIK